MSPAQELNLRPLAEIAKTLQIEVPRSTPPGKIKNGIILKI